MRYAANDMKTEHRAYVTGINCTEKNAAQTFMRTKAAKDNTSGRLCYHASTTTSSSIPPCFPMVENSVIFGKAQKLCGSSMTLTKFSAVKNLQAEYAALMAEKKAPYSDYRKSQEEMKELLTAKAEIGGFPQVYIHLPSLPVFPERTLKSSKNSVNSLFGVEFFTIF